MCIESLEPLILEADGVAGEMPMGVEGRRPGGVDNVDARIEGGYTHCRDSL